MSNIGMFSEITGYEDGQAIHYSKIKNISVYGSIVGSENVGGVAGKCSFAFIQNCTNYAKINTFICDNYGQILYRNCY